MAWEEGARGRSPQESMDTIQAPLPRSIGSMLIRIHFNVTWGEAYQAGLISLQQKSCTYPGSATHFVNQELF